MIRMNDDRDVHSKPISIFKIIITVDFTYGFDHILKTYDEYRAKADPNCCCDYGLHVIIPYIYPQLAQEMKILVEEKGNVLIIYCCFSLFGFKMTEVLQK